MARNFVGNVRDAADTHEQIFGGPAYVAAGLFGDGLWTNLGLVVNVSINRMLFSQATQNVLNQTMGQSNFQAFKSAEISLTLRRFQIEQMAALYPGITEVFTATDSRNAGLGHNTVAQVITPTGLCVLPQYAAGANAVQNNPNTWWMPAAVAGDELGEFIFKVEDTRESAEDFTLSFVASLLTTDYTPGTAQNIRQAGQILYRGDTRHIVTSTWEKNLPFGFLPGAPGRVESFTAVPTGGSEDDSITLTWTDPSADYIDDPITGYTVYSREANTDDDFDTQAISAGTLTAAVSSLDPSTEYEFRVAPIANGIEGQLACVEATTAASS